MCNALINNGSIIQLNLYLFLNATILNIVISIEAFKVKYDIDPFDLTLNNINKNTTAYNSYIGITRPFREKIIREIKTLYSKRV